MVAVASLRPSYSKLDPGMMQKCSNERQLRCAMYLHNANVRNNQQMYRRFASIPAIGLKRALPWQLYSMSSVEHDIVIHQGWRHYLASSWGVVSLAEQCATKRTSHTCSEIASLLVCAFCIMWSFVRSCLLMVKRSCIFRLESAFTPGVD